MAEPLAEVRARLAVTRSQLVRAEAERRSVPPVAMRAQLALWEAERTTGPCGYQWDSAGTVETCALPVGHPGPVHMTANRAAGISVGIPEQEHL